MIVIKIISIFYFLFFKFKQNNKIANAYSLYYHHIDKGLLYFLINIL